MAAPALDLTALTAPVTRDELGAWRSAMRAAGHPWTRPPTQQLVSLIIGAVIAGFFVLPIVGIFGAAIGEAIGGPVFGPIGFFVFLAVSIGAAVAIIRVVVAGSSRWEHWYRLHRLAEANGLRYAPQEPAPGYPGVIFGIGHQRAVVDRFTTTSGRAVDFGNLRYVTGSGKSRRVHQWGFLAVGLDRRLPHMVLDSRANNRMLGLSNLPAGFRRDQILSLEGDFDRYFTLYCPKEYERDALYVFTPDLMALLIDEAAPYDVEVVDHWMLVYSSQPFATADPRLYQRLFRIVGTVGAKTVDRTDRYHDERTGAAFAANIVAPQGTRLKRGLSSATIVTLVAVVAIWVWSIAADLIAGR